MPTRVIQSHQYRQLRAELKDIWQTVNAACWICGQATIQWDAPPADPDAFELDHIESRKARPDLAYERTNMAPSHLRCNRAKGAGPAAPTIGETTEDW